MSDGTKKISLSLTGVKSKPIGVSLGRALAPSKPSVPLNIQVEEEKPHVVTITESSSTSLEDLKRLQAEVDGTVKKELVIPVAPDRAIVPPKPTKPTTDATSTENTIPQPNEGMTDEEQAVLAAARAALEDTTPTDSTVEVPDIMALDEDLMGDEPDADDYEEVPIEAFGAAMLRGMGWAPGVGVGRTNKLVVPEVDLNAGHNGRLGLGADASTLALKNALAKQEAAKKKEEEQAKPQTEKKDVWQERKAKAAAEMSSRVIKVRALTLRVGGLVEIKTGEHSGMYGRVVKMDKRDDKSDDWTSIDVRMNVGGHILRRLIPSDVDVVDEAALPPDHPALLDYDYRAAGAGVLRGIKAENAESTSGHVKSEDIDGREDGRGSNSRASDRDRDHDRNQEKNKDKEKDRDRERDVPRANERSERGADREKGREGEDRKLHSDAERGKDNTEWSWVRPNIVVKIVDPKHEYYRHKGIVERISERSGCCYIQLEAPRDKGKSKVRDEIVSVRKEREFETNRKDSDRMRVDVEVDVGEGKFEKVYDLHFDDVCMWQRANRWIKCLMIPKVSLMSHVHSMS